MGQRHYIDLVGSLGHRSLAVLLLLMCICYALHGYYSTMWDDKVVVTSKLYCDVVIWGESDRMGWNDV